MSVLDYIVGRLKRGIITFVGMVSLAHRDWPYNDHMKDETLATVQSYVVGTDNLGRSGSQTKRFISKLTPIFCTTDTYVIFNNVNDVPHYLLANTWYNFKINIWSIHYYYVTAEGTIYVHFGGVLPQEARTPE